MKIRPQMNRFTDVEGAICTDWTMRSPRGGCLRNRWIPGTRDSEQLKGVIHVNCAWKTLTQPLAGMQPQPTQIKKPRMEAFW